MKRLDLLLFTALVLTLALPATAAEDATLVPETAVERGRYLVHDVAMCVQCHSPRDRRGELRTDRLLTGGPVPVSSPYDGPRWAFHAPNLLGVPGYTEEQFVTLMTSGERPDGTMPRGPMPPFRMTERDARDVWQYLKAASR